jgi:hypothetical protein
MRKKAVAFGFCTPYSTDIPDVWLLLYFLQPRAARPFLQMREPDGHEPYLSLLDCALEMRQLGWAHFAVKGLQSEAEAILAEVSADGC